MKNILTKKKFFRFLDASLRWHDKLFISTTPSRFACHPSSGGEFNSLYCRVADAPRNDETLDCHAHFVRSQRQLCGGLRSANPPYVYSLDASLRWHDKNNLNHPVTLRVPPLLWRGI